ncbi:MAG: hypothetical protein AAF629_33240 [Chloroflexota bacterium]
MSSRLIRNLTYAFLALITLLYLIVRFNVNLQPFNLTLARLLANRNIVDFQEVFNNTRFETTIRVCSVQRVNTDADPFDEWLVFYQSDPIRFNTSRQPCPDSSPWFGAVYDMDRGEPPVVFPYRLTPPNRDSLGDAGTRYTLADVVANQPDILCPGDDESILTAPINELFVYGQMDGYSQLNPERIDNQLTIFKFQPNTQCYDNPTNTPPKPRYKVVGAFTGSGGVTYDPTTKEVTVNNFNDLGRSQLTVRNTYALLGPQDDRSYMSTADPSQLANPIQSTIDFAFGPPEDILNTEYPEQIVLAFYKSLDINKPSGEYEWDPEDFLAPEGTRPEEQCVKNPNVMSDALAQYKAGHFEYFFTDQLNTDINADDIYDLSIIQLRYFPKLETTPNQGTLLGEEPICGRVDIQIAGGDPAKIPNGLISYEMIYLGTQWKINRRLQ